MSVLVRILLLFILAVLAGRALLRLVAGIVVGASLPPSASAGRRGVPDRGVQMVRDPVCGTFLPPADALTITARDGAVRYFCSEACRKQFQARVPAHRS